jgi:hypothetical protein
MRNVLFAVLPLVPQSAAAYTCTLSPSKDAVIVKTGNPDARPKSCTVTCFFAVPGGGLVRLHPPDRRQGVGRARERRRKMRAALTRVTVLARAVRYTPQ